MTCFRVLYLLSLTASICPGKDDAAMQRALSLPQRTENKVFRSSVTAHWLPDGRSFWYSVQTGPTAREFVLIDAQTGARKSGADLASLGIEAQETKTSKMTIQSGPTRRTGIESAIKFVNKLKINVELFWINQAGEHVRYGSIRPDDERVQQTFEGHVWFVTTPAGEPLASIEAAPTLQTIIIDGHAASTDKADRKPPNRRASSPDGKWEAYVENGLVKLRNMGSDGARVLTTDLDGKSPFGREIKWSPDSKAFVVSNCAPVPLRRINVVESAPKGQVQPKLRDFEYAKPGDPLPKPFPVIFRLTESGYEWTRVKSDLFPNPFILGTQLPIRWSDDGSEFRFDYNERGHQLYRVLAVDKAGAVRTVVEETSRTFIDYTQKTWRHWLDKTGELLWMSERDGWCHVWLYDARTGTLKNQVTKGAWPVREVIHVDDDKREIWFMASGLRTGEDPYHKHLCRVKFDGSAFTQLTESDGQHSVEFSPTREFFIATWSRADHAPVTELRRSTDGSLVCVLEKADAAGLLATGWSMPERFVAKGRDGSTDIHGVIIKPSAFDPAKRYPVVEEIYAGPHSAFAPKEFGRLLRQHQIAELGVVVVQMDGMGTNHRGKAFHDVCWKNLKDAGFRDRIAWIKAAAATRPWMDLDRVGIYGGSAGGQNAMRALLDHHEFYKVAVADCGCHDNRMDKIWWNEQWLGWPVDESYARNSNVEDAAKMEGRLLLIVGEMDNNVDPASTMQVVGALQRAGKSFEYMPIAGAGHGAAETPYGSKARMEFLVKHLQP